MVTGVNMVFLSITALYSKGILPARAHPFCIDIEERLGDPQSCREARKILVSLDQFRMSTKKTSLSNSTDFQFSRTKVDAHGHLFVAIHINRNIVETALVGVLAESPEIIKFKQVAKRRSNDETVRFFNPNLIMSKAQPQNNVIPQILTSPFVDG